MCDIPNTEFSLFTLTKCFHIEEGKREKRTICVRINYGKPREVGKLSLAILVGRHKSLLTFLVKKHLNSILRIDGRNVAR